MVALKSLGTIGLITSATGFPFVITLKRMVIDGDLFNCFQFNCLLFNNVVKVKAALGSVMRGPRITILTYF